MDIHRLCKRDSLIYEKKEQFLLKDDDIIMNNIRLYNDQYGKKEGKWGKLVKEDINKLKMRNRWIQTMITITDEFEFSFDTCEIALHFLDLFFEMKLENRKETTKYESIFLKNEFEDWIEIPNEVSYLLSVIISLSCKYQELQKDSNIIIKGIDKKKMARGEYEMMDYFDYIVPYKTPSFFLYLYVEDFLNPEKIIFYTYRIIEDIFKYSYYVNTKFTLLSFSILKCVFFDIFKQPFLLSLWKSKVQYYIKDIDERQEIEEIYQKLCFFVLKTEGYIEHLHHEYKMKDIFIPIINKKPIDKEKEDVEEVKVVSTNYQYTTPKKVKVQMIVNIGDWGLPNPPLKKVKINE